jgi:hypothetical protein
LLLCVDAVPLPRFKQVELMDGCDDSTFFEQIRTAYEDICSTPVVRYTEGTPDWVRAAVRLSYGLGGAFEKFIIKVFDWLHVRWLVRTVGNSVFFVPSTANFVQV